MQNGTRKGGAPGPMQTILSSPGLEALWQMHWSYNALLEQNSPGLYIANIEDMPAIAGVLTAPARGRGRRDSSTHSRALPHRRPRLPTTPTPRRLPVVSRPQRREGAGESNATGHTPRSYSKSRPTRTGASPTNTRNGFSKTYGPRSVR
jgi:hypothetical protein